MENISRRQLLGIAAGALAGGLGMADVSGKDKFDSRSGCFTTQDFKKSILGEAVKKYRAYVANTNFPIIEDEKFFNIDAPSFSYPIALGILFEGDFEGMLRLSLTNVDTKELIFSRDCKVKGPSTPLDNGRYRIINRPGEPIVAPFYLYRADWELDGKYLDSSTFGRAPRASDIKGK